MALRRNLCDFAPRANELASDTRKIPWRPAKVMMGHHHARGKKYAPKFRRRKMFHDLNFDIAPAAARPRRLRQNLKLGLATPSKQTATPAAAARCDQRRTGTIAG
jgi:hypothetical protein